MEADCLLHSQKAAGSPYSTRHRGKSRRTYVDDGSEVEAEIATRPSRLVPKRRTLDLDGSLLAGKKDRRPAKDRLFFSNDRNGGVYTLTLQNGETVRVNGTFPFLFGNEMTKSMQIAFTLYANHLASHTIWPGSWNSLVLLHSLQSSMLLESIGFIDLGTSCGRIATLDCYSLQCTQTSLR